VEGAETPPKPKKPKWMHIYNNSMKGQKVTLHNGKKLAPGCSAPVPYALGKALVEKVWYIKRAERGDTMD
jgi:hypothetical protein